MRSMLVGGKAPNGHQCRGKRTPLGCAPKPKVFSAWGISDQGWGHSEGAVLRNDYWANHRGYQ